MPPRTRTSFRSQAASSGVSSDSTIARATSLLEALTKLRDAGAITARAAREWGGLVLLVVAAEQEHLGLALLGACALGGR
jgi:hypothetical protein